MGPFFFLLLLMGGVFAAIFSLAAKVRRQAARAAKTDPEASTTPPVRTAPSAAPQRPAAPAVPRVQTEGRMRQPTAPYRAEYAKKPVEQPKKPVPKQPEPSVAVRPQPAQQPTELSFTGSDALRGVLYAEILGKPKALR